MRFFSLQFRPYGANLQVMQKVTVSLKFRAFPAIKSSKNCFANGFYGPAGLDGMIRSKLSCIAIGLLITIGGGTSRSKNRFYPTGRPVVVWLEQIHNKIGFNGSTRAAR